MPMKTVKIKLGEKMSEKGCPEPLDSSDVYYPSVHFSSDEEYDLPKEGVMLVRYKKTSSSEHMREGEKPRYECTLELKEIIATNGKKEDEEYMEKSDAKRTEEALDEIAKSLGKE